MQARSLLFPGTTPGHSFLRSATQCPTLHCRSDSSCAVAFDDHNIKTAPIIRTIFTTKGPPNAASGGEKLIGFAMWAFVDL
jgi:hypothetical protein